MKPFELNAEVRTAHGRPQNRRLRREGRVPAILYGGNGEPVMLSVDRDDLNHHLDNEAFYSHVIKINIKDGATEEAVLRALQRHPARPFIEHMDLLRIVAGETLRMSIPLHFIGEEDSPGVKDEAGIFQHSRNDVEVECLPRNLPEYIEVDCSAMGLHDALHLSDLKMPEGVELVELMHDDAADATVVSVQLPRAALELEAEEAEEAEAAEMAAALEDDGDGAEAGDEEEGEAGDDDKADEEDK